MTSGLSRLGGSLCGEAGFPAGVAPGGHWEGVLAGWGFLWGLFPSLSAQDAHALSGMWAPGAERQAALGVIGTGRHGVGDRDDLTPGHGRPRSWMGPHVLPGLIWLPEADLGGLYETESPGEQGRPGPGSREDTQESYLSSPGGPESESDKLVRKMGGGARQREIPHVQRLMRGPAHSCGALDAGCGLARRP